MIKKIGVLTSGGDAPGMNACLRAVVRTGLTKGYEMYFIYNGFRGIIEEKIEKCNRHSVSDIINRGGTIIGTARLPEFSDESMRIKAADILKKHGIDALVTIGGDGTYRGAAGLTALGINCIGIPATIDNDIASTDYTIGFDTALNTIIECVDRLRDTSSSHQRCSVIEVMGRNCGDLACFAGVACGAELIITKENLMPKIEIINLIKEQQKDRKGHVMILIAEKICDVREFAREIERDCGIETKSEVLGHLQRGGSPSGQDRVLAARLGNYAIKLLSEGKSGVAVGTKGHNLIQHPFDVALSMAKKDFSHLIKVGREIE